MKTPRVRYKVNRLSKDGVVRSALAFRIAPTLGGGQILEPSIAPAILASLLELSTGLGLFQNLRGVL